MGSTASTSTLIEAGTFFYALLHIVEGTGLILERDWAGYLTVIATSALVPFECYEILQKVNPLKILVLIVNLGFVVYVVVKLRQEHRERRAQRSDAGLISRQPGLTIFSRSASIRSLSRSEFRKELERMRRKEFVGSGGQGFFVEHEPGQTPRALGRGSAL